jgi:hypothetical protein
LLGGDIVGFRFRKSFKIAPGVRFNVGKKGVGVSVGGKGFRTSVNTSGRKTTTVGIPGTGLSYTTTSSSKKKRASHSNHVQAVPTPKSKTIALILCICLGYLGGHQFYVGKKGTGILYFFTLGLCGIGWLVDIYRITTGSFKDVYGLELQ